MNTYKVEIKITHVSYVRVEAENENAAVEIAKDIIDMSGYCPDDFLISTSTDVDCTVFKDY